ncbi:MAG: aminotransferase class I/II-fold pyridoxal phosphate-dependent enzyme [Oscillospiraceae bacterium]|nr:aminotransferase class I/II-fold pyridoxal phosphate-dependent enzyme [Oscillospiraceae bacterium]
MEELCGIVRRCFAQTLMMDESEIGDSADFFEDLGGDSLDSLDCAVRLEEECGLSLPEEPFSKCRCVLDAARLIYEVEQGTLAAPAEEKKEIRPITRFEDTPEYAAFHARLDPMEATHTNPYFFCNDSPLRDTSVHDGKEILNFSSYNYAGMSGRPETIKAAQEAAAHYGCSASASRLLGGEKPIHKALEEAIAKWKHAEDAVVLVGGHSTNVTIVGNFCGKNDLILYDALAHNSVHEGTRLSDAESRPFPHNNYEALETILRNARDQYEKVLIVVEGVYSMDGDIAPIPEFVRIK